MSQNTSFDELNSASGIFNRDVILEDLFCSICYEYFNNPKTLTCQHTFCNNCVEPFLNNSELTCPLCREVFKCDDINLVPKNTLLANLIESLKNAKAECPTCKKVDFLQVCNHCAKVCCKDCKEEHVKVTIAELRKHHDDYMNDREQNLQSAKITAKFLQQEAIENTIKSIGELEQQMQLLLQVKKLSLIEDIKKFYEYKLSEVGENFDENLNKMKQSYNELNEQYKKNSNELNKDLKYIQKLTSLNKSLKELILNNEMDVQKVTLDPLKFESMEYKLYTCLLENLTYKNLKDGQAIKKNCDVGKNLSDDTVIANKLSLTLAFDNEKLNLKVSSAGKDANDLKANMERLIKNAKIFLSKQSIRSNNEVTSDELGNLKQEDVNILRTMNYAEIMCKKYIELKIEINNETRTVYYNGLQNDIVNAQKEAERLLNETKFKKYEFDAIKLKFLELNSKFINDWSVNNNHDCVVDAVTTPGYLVVYSTNTEKIDKCYEILNDEIIIKKHSLSDDTKTKIKEYLIHLLTASINNNEILETILFQHYLIKQTSSSEFFICGFKNETRKAYFEAQKCDAIDLDSFI